MMTPLFSRASLLLMLGLGLATSPVNAQAESSEAPEGTDVVLASIEAPLTREALNATRIALEEQGHAFRYGSFQFRPDGALVGVEIVLRVDGEEHHDYVEFVSETCVLRIMKAEGLVMEGC